MNTFGNTDILKQSKTAFLCSRKCPTSIILKSYDWAKEQRDNGVCVISGFHSIIEKDVLHFLLKGNQPIILALARGLKKRYEPEIKKAIEEKRLLVVTPFEESTIGVSRRNATIRNEFMCEMADEIFIPYATPGGNIEKLARKFGGTKKISTFEIEENRNLFDIGIVKII